MKKSRRILSIILTALMVVTMIPFTPVDFAASAAATASDDGTALTPTMISAETYKVLGLTDSNWSNYEGYYAIGTPQELRGFSALVKGGETTANALLLRNIVCNKAYEWEPIGIGAISYKGTFDGNGCTVSGLSIDESEEGFGSDWGMFGVCVDATIKNLILSDSSISGSYTIGGIVGSAYDVTIENCKVTATVSVTANDLYTSTENPETNGAYVGGIVGSSFRSANLRNCVSFATVWSKRTAEYAGSVSGDIPSEYDNCFYLKGSASAGAGVTAPKRELYGIGLPSDQITAEDGCITLESSDSAHTCISVTHQQINANCLYTGLSEYSFCLICDKVTADTKTVLPLDFGNHIGAETEIQQSTTSGKHNIVYLCCGEIKETVDCVYGDSGNCNEVQICTQCGATGSVISDKHTGTATEYRKVNDTTHQLYYLCCDAPVAGTSQPHTMSKAADCQNGAYCSICKDYFGEKDPSNHTSQTFVNQQVAGNDTQHKRMHSCCEAYTMEDHDYTGTGNCLNSQRCSDCHYIGPKVPNNHAYKRYILIYKRHLQYVQV